MVSKMAKQLGSPIEIKPKLYRRFYEPAILEKALVGICKNTLKESPRAPNHIPDASEGGAKEAFQAFVCRLAQVCDSRHGGDTVTAIIVLQDFREVHYFVGSNKRNEGELVKVKAFIESLLKQAEEYTSPKDVHKRRIHEMGLLWRIIKFNTPRIKVYVNGICRFVDQCIENLDEDPDLKDVLLQLKVLASFQADGKVEEDQFLRSSAKLIQALDHHIRREEIRNAIIQHSKEGDIDARKHWSELSHNIGRLQSYQVAVRVLTQSRERWPELFNSPKVTTVASSIPAPHPLNKAPKAREIVGRWSGDKEKIEAYRRDAESFEVFKLDDAILEECEKNIRPIVHAEILVYHHVVRYLKTEEPGIIFFKDWNYVGSSKPTCRLCSHYFSLLTGIEVRKSHGNLYTPWRLPDVFDEKEHKQREKHLNELCHRLREDAIETMKKKLPQGKAHDSSSFPAMPGFFKASNVDQASHSDITSLFDRLSITRSKREPLSVMGDIDERSVLGEEASETEEDGGGVLIFRGRSM